MHVSTNGKVHRSTAEWRAIMERYEQSGLGAAAFCLQEGIALNSFKQRSAQRQRVTQAATAFVELSPPPAPAAAGWEVELTLPNGVRVAVRGAGRVE